MDQFDILFKLKDLFKDPCSKQVISRLIQFPLTCEYLRDSGNLQFVTNHLGNGCRLWTLANICKIAVGVSITPVLSKTPDHKDNSQIESLSTTTDLPSIREINLLKEIYPVAQQIIKLNKTTLWKGIFDKIGLQSYLFNDSKKILETVLSVVYELAEDKIELINELFDFSIQDSGPKHLAHLLMLDESIGEILIFSSKSILPKTAINNFTAFIRELQFLGDQKYFSELIKGFIDNNPFDERVFEGKGTLAFPDELEKLLYLKNYAALFQIIGDKKESERLTNIAKMVMASVEEKLDFISSSGNPNNQNPDRNSFDIDIQIDDRNPEPLETGLAQEINRIKRIAKTDIESAKAIADEVFKKLIKDSNLAISIFKEDFGFLITPENLIQVYIDLGLLCQAQALSNKLLKYWPQNHQLLKKVANFFHGNGDHQDAVMRFFQLEMIDSLSREEKIKFASSLEYTGRWKDALEIRKGINVTSDIDIVDAAVSAYYAGNWEYLGILISDNRFEIQSPLIINILSEIIKNEKSQISIFQEKLHSLDLITEKDHKSILLAADHVQDAGKFDKAILILEEYAHKFSFSFPIVNRLYNLYQQTGELEKSRQILETDLKSDTSDQQAFETYVENLIHIGNIDKADRLLNTYFNLWELSPRKLNLTAKTLIEKGKYHKAKEILRSIIDAENCDVDCLFDYCLASLECRLSDFPVGVNAECSSNIDEITELVDCKIHKDNIFLELLEAELACDNKLGKYEQLLQKYSKEQNPEVWRISAGLGKVYFNQKQYDSTIINIVRAFETMPDNESLLWILIQCYANLRLWNEVENLLTNNPELEKQSILKGIKNFDIFSISSEWSRFLEKQVQKKPDETIYKILFAKSLVISGNKTDAVEFVKSFYEDINVEDDFYLYCAQILIDAKEPLLAERLIEIYLSNKKTLDQNDYLSSAFLFERLGNSKKTLAMLNHLEIKDPALLTYKAKILYESGNLNQSQSIIKNATEYDETDVINLEDIFVHIPDTVKSLRSDPALVYLMASSVMLTNKDIDKAITFLERGLIKFPENQEIIFNLLELLNITSKNVVIEKIISEQRQTLLDISLPQLSCLMGEIALSQNEEVTCARYLSAALKERPDNPRVKALQARMIAINGNFLEAQKIFNSVIEEIKNSGTNQESIIQSGDQAVINSKLWLGQAALDLKDYHTALEICQQEIENFGIFSPCVKLFLSAFASLLEEDFILREIKVYSHLKPIADKVKTTFADILENLANAYSNNIEIFNLVIRCQIYLENDLKTLAKTEKLPPEIENINSIIYGIYKTKGHDAAEIAINSLQKNTNHQLFLAILEKDEYPQLALSHIKQVIAKSSPDVFTHASLAIIENNLGNISDSYAAICLALDQWPDEYEWQTMAGDLSKASGDIHTSLMHYEKAQKINIKPDLDKEISALYLYLESESAIPILEAQLSKNLEKDKLIQLGKICLKFGKYRKAINALETAVKNYPQDSFPYYWLSEIALRLNNPDKALINIEKAITNDGSNPKFIYKKANILNKIGGYARAINYLDDELSKKKDSDDDLLRLKTKLISENEGDIAALQFLNSMKNHQDNPVLLLERARLELRMGSLDESELKAEKLLNQKDNKSDALALLGLIANVRGELDRAIDFYIKAIEDNPFSPEQYIQLAEIYHDKKDFKRALDTLEDGIKVNPGSFELLLKAGLYFYQHGLYSDAEKRIKEAIKIEPDSKDAKDILRLLENVRVINTGSMITQFAE